MMPDFVVGQIYNRRKDLHEVHGGQRQGGISTPNDCPSVFLFTGESGDTYGYHDEFREDGTFWYTGEGQTGDMQMVRGNRAIRDHAESGKTLAVFEQVSRGHVRFVGWADYLDHHIEERPDIRENLRSAIVFELSLRPEIPDSDVDTQATSNPQRLSEKETHKLTLEELREIALGSAQKASNRKVQRVVVHNRALAVKKYVLMRADGTCEGCDSPAPFLNKRSQPYLEPHHTHRIADGGPDRPDHVIALCPTCHRRVHYGIDGKDHNESLIKKLAEIEMIEETWMQERESS
jgi:5-methylcytosine-specific restriction protein A